MQQKLDAASAAVAAAEKQSKRTATAEQKRRKVASLGSAGARRHGGFKNLQVLRLAQASPLLARELKDGEPCAVWLGRAPPRLPRASSWLSAPTWIRQGA